MRDFIKSIQKAIFPVTTLPQGTNSSNHSGSLSDAELALLIKFLSPLKIPVQLNAASWGEVLQRPLTSVISDFKAKNLIVNGSLRDQLEALTVVDLKSICKQKNISSAGKKNQIINQILSDPNLLSEPLSPVLVCSPTGKLTAQKHKDSLEADRLNTLRLTVAELEAYRFSNATKIIAAYESRQVFTRGIGINWTASNDPTDSVPALKIMFQSVPKILNGLSDIQIQQLRIAGSLAMLLGEKEVKEYLPTSVGWSHRLDPAEAARMIVFFANNERAKLRAQSENYFTGYVNVLTSYDCCESCKPFSNKRYLASKAPELPHQHCTESRGCRCSFQPETRSLDSIVRG